MFLDEIKKPNSVNILLGDININALDENNSQTEEYFSLFTNRGFLSYCNVPTRGPNCLHYIIIVNPFLGELGKVFVLQSRITDHNPVLFTHDSQTKKSKWKVGAWDQDHHNNFQ